MKLWDGHCSDNSSQSRLLWSGQEAMRNQMQP
jgi:hypothetical protein